MTFSFSKFLIVDKMFFFFHLDCSERNETSFFFLKEYQPCVMTLDSLALVLVFTDFFKKSQHSNPKLMETVY